MAEFVQLIYASRATFKPNIRGGIDREVARILMESRRNNSKRDVGGVLYYGDGNFFQCLEGESAAVDKVFEKIKHDPRHSQIRVLAKRTVANRKFESWSMKYISVQDRMRHMLQKNGFSTFEPYKFNDAMITQVIEILSKTEDHTQGAKLLKEAGLISWLLSLAIFWQMLLGVIFMVLLTFGIWIFV